MEPQALVTNEPGVLVMIMIKANSSNYSDVKRRKDAIGLRVLFRSEMCCTFNKRNMHTNLPPFFDPTKSWEVYTAESRNSLVFQLFVSLSLTHGHGNMLLDTVKLLQRNSCLYPVHTKQIACWQCWNNITSLALSIVKLSRLCLKALNSCKIF
jgi:hypothetical protein